MERKVLSNLIINKVCTAATMYNDAGAFSKRENRPYWGIILKFEGETVYSQNGVEYVSDNFNIVILPKGSSYEWKCNKAGHFAIVEFDSDLEYDEILTFSVSDGERFLKMLKNIEYKRNIKKPMYEQESIRDIYSLIIELSKVEDKRYFPEEKRKKIAPAIEYIAKNYTRQIKNIEIAEICGLSEVYLRKLFSEIYGVSPMAYVKKLKIKKAKEMLESDFGSISDIAHSLGYSNIYDFSRDFKKQVGVSPTKYIK